MRLIQFESVTELRKARAAWDRLWKRSEVTLPTTRAELVAQWIEQFAPRSRICVLAVEQDGEMLAALPLAARRIRGVLNAGDLTRNFWSPNGDLLLDPEADSERVLDFVAEAIGQLSWSLVWFDVVPGDASRWSSLVSGLAGRGLAVDTHLRGRNAELVLTKCFEEYEATLSSQHRYNLRRNWKRLRAIGQIRVRFFSEFKPDDVDQQLSQAFEIEHRSWKSQAGGSILATSGMSDFFLRQANTLAEWGCLRLALLECNGQPIAFELGYSAKGVYHSGKISYDQAYRKYGPGQILRSELIRWLHSQPGQSRMDFHAEASPSLARWSNSTYPISRVVVAPRRSASSAIFAAYRGLAPLLRRLRVASAR